MKLINKIANVFVAFTLVLGVVAVATKTVSAAEGTWTKVDSITSGEKYLITSTVKKDGNTYNNKKYYLGTTSEGTVKPIEFTDTAGINENQGWIFTETKSNSGKYHVSFVEETSEAKKTHYLKSGEKKSATVENTATCEWTPTFSEKKTTFSTFDKKNVYLGVYILNGSDFKNEWRAYSSSSQSNLVGTGDNFEFYHFEAAASKPAPTSLELSAAPVDVYVGEEFTITPTFNATDVDTRLTWTTSAEGFATVENGVVTPVAAGEVTITATSVAAPSVTNSITFTVKEKPVVAPTGVTLSAAPDKVYIGKPFELTATVTPEDATNKNVKWETSDALKATVENGKITPLAVGEVTITAKAVADESKLATVTFTVEKEPDWFPGEKDTLTVESLKLDRYNEKDEDFATVGTNQYATHYVMKNSGIQFKSGHGYIKNSVEYAKPIAYIAIKATKSMPKVLVGTTDKTAFEAKVTDANYNGGYKLFKFDDMHNYTFVKFADNGTTNVDEIIIGFKATTPEKNANITAFEALGSQVSLTLKYTTKGEALTVKGFQIRTKVTGLTPELKAELEKLGTKVTYGLVIDGTDYAYGKEAEAENSVRIEKTLADKDAEISFQGYVEIDGQRFYTTECVMTITDMVNYYIAHAQELNITELQLKALNAIGTPADPAEPGTGEN